MSNLTAELQGMGEVSAKQASTPAVPESVSEYEEITNTRWHDRSYDPNCG